MKNKTASVKTKKITNFLTYDFSKVSEVDIVFTLRHLSVMLKAGISITEALQSLKKLTQNSKLKAVYNSIYEDVSSGMSMAESMRKHPKIFKTIITTVIEVGEQTGTLEDNLKYLATYLKKEYELNRKLKGAMLYPIVVLLITLGEMLGVLFFIIPQLQTLFESFPNKPQTTVIILNSAEFIRGNFIWIVLILAVIIIATSIFVKTKVGKRVKDYLSLHIPVFSKLTKFNIFSNFTRTLSILMKTGIPLYSSLKTAGSTISNSIYKELIENKVYESFKAGNELGESLREYPKYFPESLLVLIESGEKSGTLNENLKFAHKFYSDESEDMINSLTALLEPIMLVLIGLMIGLLAIMIIIPLYQLLGSIG